ncbi:low temperature requirement protein A [Verrucosispora sioxanthis]|uniref:Low temperature requirement protein A n=1 Tax=Verrucosispora sioxanthis TaxID=2499994 RepID=A0A6M1LA57_9ACTN|nr:low temperature requirement protein A [Verrucosispora sioxanthis]NEE66025.1 low temperature requirement protein A [Verrucosispora sioxanthis]NGM15135.1 low temperature requirement protein A [Verrucosispora sioxanthis]
MSAPPQLRRSRWLRPVMPGSRVTRLELFFDLIFVFAFLNVAGLVSVEVTTQAVLSGVVVLALLWFCWTTFATLGNLVRADYGLLPLLGFGVMAAAFVLAIAIPQAFLNQPDDLTGPVVFAVAYLVLRGLTLVTFLYALSAADRNRRQLVVISVPAVVAVLVGLAATASNWAPAEAVVDVRLALWVAALLVEYSVGLFLPYARWAVASAGHWAERHSLIVIIALGEAVISLGLGPGRFDRLALTAPVITGSVLGIALLATLWWLHFDTLLPSVEQAMHGTRGPERIALARDVFSYLHFVTIVAIVGTALGLKLVLEVVAVGEAGPLPWPAVSVLYGSVALYLLMGVAVAARTFRRLRSTALAAAVVVSLLAVPAAALTPLVALAVLVAVCGVLVVIQRYSAADARARIKASLHAEERVVEEATSEWRRQHL